MNEFKRTTFFLIMSSCLLGFMPLAFSSEIMPFTEMRIASIKYLDAFSTGPERQAMKKKLMDQVETKKSDNGVTEEDAMSQILLTWGLANLTKFEQRQREVMVQFCYYFLMFMEKQYTVPKLMTDRMPPEKMRQLIVWLNSESTKAGASTLAMR